MAVIRYGPVVQSARGSLGGLIFARQGGTPIVRTRPKPFRPDSPLQLQTRSRYSTLIAAWRAGDQIRVQVPFARDSWTFPQAAAAAAFPPSFSLIEADGGLIADLYRRNGELEALVLAYDPKSPVRLVAGSQESLAAGPSPLTLRVELATP